MRIMPPVLCYGKRWGAKSPGGVLFENLQKKFPFYATFYHFLRYIV